MYDSKKDMKTRRRRVGGVRRSRGEEPPSEVGTALGVGTEVWQVVGRGVARLTGDEHVSRGNETNSGACIPVTARCTTTEDGAMANGRCRSRSSVQGECSWDGLRGESRTIGDDVREASSTQHLSISATIFDDMTAAPVLSAVLSDRVECGAGGLCGRKSSSGVCPRRRTTSRRSIAKKFSEAFTIGVCFLSILKLPSWTSAVPLGRSAPIVTMAEDRFNSKPKWINACGANIEGSDGRQSPDGRHSPVLDPEGPVAHLSDQELISTILIVAKRAQMNAERWRRDYVNQTFNLDFLQHHEAWRTNRYSWLPTSDEIPKELDGTIPDVHLEQLTFVDALKNIYTFMQKYACGLEQVTWDLEDKHSPFSKNFTDAELELRDIICEIEVALIEKGEKTPTDIQRSIMPAEFRSVDHATHRNLRDWLILRDYMNGVEYVIQVFEYLKSKMQE